MRKTHRCPKCQHAVVLHVAEVRDDDGNVMRLGGAPGQWSSAPVGSFEAFICQSCRFTEFYLKAPLGPEDVRDSRELTPDQL